MMVQTYAQNEQNMNAVERVLVYTELPAEGALTTPQDPPASWPPAGEIQFENVELAYRKGLPLVLKGVTFHVRPGEKIGIVGRTGAGQFPCCCAYMTSTANMLGVARREELPDTGLVQDGRAPRWFDCHRRCQHPGYWPGRLAWSACACSSRQVRHVCNDGGPFVNPYQSVLFLGTLRENL
jgi:hypothetical protein